MSEAHTSFPGHLGGIRLIEFSPDCRRFLSADLRMGVSVWEDGVKVRTYEFADDDTKSSAYSRVHAINVTPDGRYAFVAAGLKIRCIDLEFGYLSWQYRAPNMFGFIRTAPRALAINKEGEILVSFDSGTLEVWTPDGRQRARWRANDSPMMLAGLPDGNRFVGSDGYGLSIWDVADRARILATHTDMKVYGLATYKNSDKVLLRLPGRLATFDVFAERLRNDVHILPGLPYVDVTSDGDRIVHGEGRDAVLLDGGLNYVMTFTASENRIITAKFVPDQRQVVLGLDDGSIEWQDYE